MLTSTAVSAFPRWLAVALGVALTFVALTAAAIGIGAVTYRPPAILTELGACTFKCWYGVVVGQTNLIPADISLREQGFSAYPQYANVLSYTGDRNDCHRVIVLFAKNRISNLHLRECVEPIRVGDLMLALGPPETLMTAGYDAWLVWDGGTLDARIKGAASPFSPVLAFGANDPSIEVTNDSAWRGFLPFWRYCALTGQPLYCVAASKPA